MEDPVPSGPGCGWPNRAQTGAPPTPPLSRADTNNAGALAARRPPQPAHAASRGRATSEMSKTVNAHPELKRVVQVLGSAAPAGPVVRQADPHDNASCNQSARGANINDCRALRSRPQGQRDRARQQPRSASRGVAGCPRRRGSRRQQSGSGSGEGLPPLQRKERPVLTLRNRTPAIHWLTACCPQLRDLARRFSNLLTTPARCARPIALLVSSLPMAQ